MSSSETKKLADKAYYHKNKALINKKAKERRALGLYKKYDINHNSARDKLKLKEWFLLKKFDLSLADWNLLFELQGYCCGACGRKDPGIVGKKAGWCTDHDHLTGLIRGILCHSCNIALGHLGDQFNKVEHRSNLLVAYLKRTGINKSCIIDLNGKTAQLVHYVIVRKDISPGQQVAQSVHAAGESASPKPEPGCIAVALHARDGDHILELHKMLLEADIPHHVVIEDDGRLMAIGLRPTTHRERVRKVLSSLPLVK